MRIVTLLLTFLITACGQAQTTTKQGLSDSARLQAKVNGRIRQLLRWTDRLGDNYLVLTETGEIKPGNCAGHCTDKELYGYHFIRKDSLLWQLTDFQRACSLDNFAAFRDGAARITDLDKNGIGEIWLMYSIACTSKSSPRTLKLIMYQGKQKYAVRGTSQPSKNNVDPKYGGKFKPDREFQGLPQHFKEYGRKLWLQYLYDLP